MKKNKMLRIASILLVVTLLSTCVISGTFAKYVTKAEGEDQARVAKWGVLVTLEGGVFADKYEATDADYLAAKGQYSVEAFAEEGKTPDQVVAPGTNSTQVGTTMKATVTGKPEVAARYILEAKGIKDVVLKAGTYTDYTHLVKADDGTYGYTDTFTLKKDYAPIKWDMKISKGTTTFKVTELLYDNLPSNYLKIAENYGLSRSGCSLTDAIEIIKKVAGNDGYKNIVETALGQVVSGGRNFMLEVDKETGDVTLSYDFDPNKDMGFSFELYWTWLFDEETDGAKVMGTVNDGTEEVNVVDMADTFLGNVAAGVVTNENASTTIAATFVATAVQID